MSDESDTGNYFDEDGGPLDAPKGRFVVIDGGLEPDPLDHELCQLPENDLANADRLVRRNEAQLAFTREWGWAVFDGRRFDFSRGEQAIGQRAHEVARRMLSHETVAYYRTQKRRGEAQKDWDTRAGRFYGFCLQAGNAGRTDAMLKQAERKLIRPLSDFDADPTRLVLANGTLTLPRTGDSPSFVQKHDPAHLTSRAAKARYDPGAKCPEFDRFLERVQPDPEVRRFLGRVMGYCLTGHIEEQAYFIFQGKGGDGKSTFLTAFEGALGDYVANASIDTFLHREKKGSDHSADIARLASGVRLVKAAEPEQGARLAESVLKTLTGGEPFPARAMYREPFEFVAAWKLIISCNRKPQIRGDDRGIWRRTLVVPWPVSIPKAEMDHGLVEKLKAEASGILNWALRGWEDWVVEGLSPPQAVLDAIDDYRLTSNPFGAWYDTCCAEGDPESAREPADRLFKSYRSWIAINGFGEGMSQTAFGRALSDKNLGRVRNNGIWRTGVRLNDEGEQAIRDAEAEEAERRFGGSERA